MKTFESFLAPKLTAYIRHRTDLGYSDKSIRSGLLVFDRYVQTHARDWSDFLPVFFLDFRNNIRLAPKSVNGILCALRGFFQFQVRNQRIEENPVQEIPGYAQQAFVPFVFSPEQVGSLLQIIDTGIRKSQKYFLHDLGVALAITLLARCGFRITEPLRLERDHYRAQEATLYIEKTKFKKDRLVPIPLSVKTQIENYLAARASLRTPDHNPYLFAGPNANRLSTRHIYPIFYRAVSSCGIVCPRRVIANTVFGHPTPHSLRHSFAINTLKQVKARGKSPQHALPVLSAYMGHRKVRYTATYLKVLDSENRNVLIDFAIGSQPEP